MRESRFVRIAKLAYHIAQQTLPTYAHPESRHDYTFPRVACVNALPASSSKSIATAPTAIWKNGSLPPTNDTAWGSAAGVVVGDNPLLPAWDSTTIRGTPDPFSSFP
jgi:hypothetical protein